MTPAAVRKLVGEETDKAADAQHVQHLRGLAMQGLWVDWDAVLPAGWTLRRLLHSNISDGLLKFAVNAQCLSVGTDDNLRRWHKATACLRCPVVDAHGAPCGKQFPTLEHVLGGCQHALSSRLKWRHDSVLLVLKQHLVPHIKRINDGRVKITAPTTTFVSETGVPYDNSRSAPALRRSTRLRECLASARDWQILFDLQGSDLFTYTVFPPEIADTDRKPDILLKSEFAKLVVCFELTVPAEANVRQRHVDKYEKYAPLREEARRRGWRLDIQPIEVGYLGHMAYTMEKQLRALGFPQQQRRRIKEQVEETALRCSFAIYNSRHSPTWAKRPLLAVGDRQLIDEAGRIDDD
jgi:hypothetical protein